MSDAASTPATKPPSALWKWTKRIGCFLFLSVFACCLLTCTGGWLFERSIRNLNGEEMDRFHAEGLRGGDVKAMHEHADPEFRERHDLQELQAFLDARPGMLQRDRFHGLWFSRRVIDGVEYVKVKSKASLFSGDEWEIVCKVVDGVLVLVGISPGLDELVPSSFRYRSGSSRRHRFGD